MMQECIMVKLRGGKKRKLNENMGIKQFCGNWGIYNFCGNRRNIEYASLALGRWTPLTNRPTCTSAKLECPSHHLYAYCHVSNSATQLSISEVGLLRR